MKTVSIIIPAYNESKRLPLTLKKWIEFFPKCQDFSINEIIIVDDGSTDKTADFISVFKDDLPIEIIRIQKNQGKGTAVKAGVKKASSDFVFIYDADAAVLPEELKKLMKNIDGFDIVIGSRIIKGSLTQMSKKRRFVGKCFHLVCFPLIPQIKDASCGAKLLKTDVAKIIFEKQTIKKFAFDIEILWLAKKMNFKVKEVGIVWKEIPGSKVKIFKDSIEMFFAVLSLYKRAIIDNN